MSTKYFVSLQVVGTSMTVCMFLLFATSVSIKLEAPKRNSVITILLLDGKVRDETPKLVCLQGLEEQDPSSLLCA